MRPQQPTVVHSTPSGEHTVVPDHYISPDRDDFDPIPSLPPQPMEYHASLGQQFRTPRRGQEDGSRRRQTLEQARLNRNRERGDATPGSVHETIARQMQEIELFRKHLAYGGVRNSRSASGESDRMAASVGSQSSTRDSHHHPSRSPPHRHDTPGRSWKPMERTQGYAERREVKYTDPQWSGEDEHGGSRCSSRSSVPQVPPVDAVPRVDGRLQDLQIQLSVVRRQLQSKDDALEASQGSLTRVEKLVADLQAELREQRGMLNRMLEQKESVGRERDRSRRLSSLNTELEIERKETKQMELRLLQAEEALAALKERCDAELRDLSCNVAASLGEMDGAKQSLAGKYETKLGSVREQMEQRLLEVQREIAAQFEEEKGKLESRIEFLTRQLERKNSELEALQFKKGELQNLLLHAKDANKGVLDQYRQRFEHERKQAIHFEGLSQKLERELRLKVDECNHIRERIRKSGGGPARAPSTPSTTNKGRSSVARTPHRAKGLVDTPAKTRGMR